MFKDITKTLKHKRKSISAVCTALNMNDDTLTIAQKFLNRAKCLKCDKVE